MDSPLLSICVPTFNRAPLLGGLLDSLHRLTRQRGREIEICISDNASSDATPDVVEAARRQFQLSAIRQARNVGVTMNVIEATKLATGRWIMILGDDDDLDEAHVATLFEMLRSAGEMDWFIVGVAAPSIGEYLLRGVRPGSYDRAEIRRLILKLGLFKFGFIGMHVVPRAAMKDFPSLSFADAQAWPHIALFLRHLDRCQFIVWPEPLVKQSARGRALHWRSGDWACTNLRKLDVVAAVHSNSAAARGFFDLVLLRELYSRMALRDLFWWKVLEPDDFRARARGVYGSKYALRWSLLCGALPHATAVSLLHVTPSLWLNRLVELSGRTRVVEQYRAETIAMRAYDGIARGL